QSSAHQLRNRIAHVVDIGLRGEHPDSAMWYDAIREIRPGVAEAREVQKLCGLLDGNYFRVVEKPVIELDPCHHAASFPRTRRRVFLRWMDSGKSTCVMPSTRRESRYSEIDFRGIAYPRVVHDEPPLPRL